jgi:hypothetical protein
MGQQVVVCVNCVNVVKVEDHEDESDGEAKSILQCTSLARM